MLGYFCHLPCSIFQFTLSPSAFTQKSKTQMNRNKAAMTTNFICDDIPHRVQVPEKKLLSVCLTLRVVLDNRSLCVLFVKNQGAIIPSLFNVFEMISTLNVGTQGYSSSITHH